MAEPFLYRCRVTGLIVQGMTSDPEAARADGTEVVICPACGSIHVVDPADAPKPPPPEPE